MFHEVPATIQKTNDSRLCTLKSRVPLGPRQTYSSDFLFVLTHMSSTPHLFSVLFGGQQDSKGLWGDKNQSDEDFASKMSWRANNNNRHFQMKQNHTWCDRHYLPLRERFCVLVLVLLTTVCIGLSQTAAARKRLQCSWYLLAVPLCCLLCKSKVPHCLAPALLSASPGFPGC